MEVAVGPACECSMAPGWSFTSRHALGSDCVLRHATSIGMARTDGETGPSTLADGVDVGTQVVIIGSITSETTPSSVPARL